MADYLSLEEAAKKLGIPTERLVDLRSQGEVRGFRDGASWKFPETEISRLADELAVSGEGSGYLVGSDLGVLGKSSGNIIGGDDPLETGSGSDLEIGNEPLADSGSGGSDVNLVAEAGGVGSAGSDVNLVSSGSSSGGISSGSSIEKATKPPADKAAAGKKPADKTPADDDDQILFDDHELAEIDSKILSIEAPALLHDSDDELDLGIDMKEGSTGPKKGSTGPTIGQAVDKESSVSSLSMEDSGSLLSMEDSGSLLSMEDSGSLNIGAEPEDELAMAPESDLSFSGAIPDDDSDDIVLGDDDDSAVLGSDILDDSSAEPKLNTEASSLELMNELDMPSSSEMGIHGSSGVDVLSELDLLGSDSGGSGLISGDSENLLVSSGGLGSSLGDDILGEMDDALADDDDLVIADDDDDLVIDSSGTDISVAGDSGINLMSPSDSGLSLESEPLDLAGSSISALDLGAELSEGSDPSGVAIEEGLVADSGGAMVDFQADEEFQLSPSGIGLEADLDSGSQVIEVEDSEAIGEAVEFADAGLEADPFADQGGGFADAPVAAEEAGLVADAGFAEDEEEEAVPAGLDTTAARRTAGAPVPAPVGGYEVPFGIFQNLGLLCILAAMTLCGMLMTDLVRNMWTYTESSAPVSSITSALLEMVGW